MIVLGLLFLGAIAITRGYVTPQVQFAGEILLCLSFIAIGLRKIDEKEDFGQLMAGIGSFGLYASFAGAYAFKHLFSTDTVIALYVGLSLVNLGFSHWRSSKSFLAIGLLGGFAASLISLNRNDPPITFALHFTILVPCALIILRNKWSGMAGLMWIVSSIALAPVVFSNFDQTYRVGAIYLNTAIAFYAYAKIFQPSSFDENGFTCAFILVITGFYALAIDSGLKGSVHTIVLAAIGLGIGYVLPKDSAAKLSTWLGALVVFAIMVPMGFSREVATYYYTIESLILVGLALQFGNVAGFGVGFASFLFGVFAYTVLPSKLSLEFIRFTPQLESLLLGLLALSTGLSIRFALKRASKTLAETALFVGSSILVALFVRLINIYFATGSSSLSTWDASGIGLALSSVVMMFLAWRFRRNGLFAIGLILGTAVICLGLTRDPHLVPQWITASLLISASITTVLAALYYVADQENAEAQTAIVTAGVLLSALFIRLIQIAGARSALGLDADSIVFLGFSILNLVWTIAWRTRATGFLILAWASFVVSTIAVIPLNSEHMPAWYRPVLLLIPIFSVCGLYVITPRKEPVEGILTGLAVLGLWPLTTDLLTEELTRPWLGLKMVAAVTISWVVLAVFLIVIGFRFNRRYLRYASLAVFASTVGKVFLVDLSELDSFVRVAMLILLGVGMVGGGYWYILWRRAHMLPRIEEEPTAT